MSTLTLADFEVYTSSLSANVVTRIDLHEIVETYQTPPAFMLGTVPVSIGMALAGEFLVGPVRLYGFKNACMTLDGIVLHEGHALSAVMFNQPDYHVEPTVRDGAVHHLPIRRVKGQAVMFSGPGYHVYGHWLVDILPRLWVLRQCGLDPSSLRYIVPEQSPKFLLQLLATFGIRADQLITYNERTEILQVDELLLPSNLRRASRLHGCMASARDYLMERVLQAAPLPELGSYPERIFVTRRHADLSRSLTNRARIEQLAAESGFAVVAPEGLTVAEQIRLFRSAREIIGEYGSGLHNSMFADPGTAVCALRGTSLHPGFIQTGLGNACCQHTGYIFADTPLEAIHQAFEIPEHLFNLAMRNMRLVAGT